MRKLLSDNLFGDAIPAEGVTLDMTDHITGVAVMITEERGSAARTIAKLARDGVVLCQDEDRDHTTLRHQSAASVGVTIHRGKKRLAVEELLMFAPKPPVAVTTSWDDHADTP